MLSGPLAQQDFSAGMVRVAPHLLPRNAAWRLPNMLLDDDGSAYKRGGTQAVSNAAFDAGLRFLWDGQLAGGHRTVFASAAELGVLAVDGVTPVGFGVGGLTVPARPAVIDGILFIGTHAYGGSRKTGSYSTGTLTATAGSTTLAGSGTSWGANIDAGMLLTIGDQVVAVASVTDDTHLELAKPWGSATASGSSYAAAPVAALPAAYRPNGIYGVAGGRLLAAEGSRIYESQGGDSSIHDATEYHELPGGEIPLAIEGLQDLGYIFTSGGVWVITNTPFDLTDDVGNAQQQLQRVSGDIVLWGAAGLAYWEDMLVVPAIDGVWLLAPGGAPQLLTRSITPLYTELVRQGMRPGLAAVSRGHLFLPVLDSANTPVTLLVCRLDRPVDIRGFGRVFGWTEWDGAGAAVSALAARTIGTPALLGAEAGTGARVLKMPTLKPDGLATDHDGSAFTWGVVSRDYATGPLNVNFVKKVQVRYELVAPTSTATLSGAYGTDARPGGVDWGSFDWGEGYWTDPDDIGFASLEGQAPESVGDTPFRWRVNKKTRYIRFRVLSSDPCTRGVLRSVEVFVRPSGRLYA